MVDGEIRLAIKSELDIVAARQRGREMALELGFSSGEATLIATAISELSRNIVLYAGSGEISLRPCLAPPRQGIIVTAADEGPGISDIQQAMRDGFSTSGSLGLGLPGVKRLMDEFEICSSPRNGTTIKVKKWRQ